MPDPPSRAPVARMSEACRSRAPAAFGKRVREARAKPAPPMGAAGQKTGLEWRVRSRPVQSAATNR